MSGQVLDLFAGPGGWDEGMAQLGIEQVLGIEWDVTACATARAAGHARVCSDVTTFLSSTLTRHAFTGLVASPPCQGFSMAGKGLGREDSAKLVEAAHCYATAELVRGRAVCALPDGTRGDPRGWVRAHMRDHRSLLALEPLRVAVEAVLLGVPFAWVAWEQVGAVLPLWSACAEVLVTFGYEADAAMVQAEAFFEPQTRKRAVLRATYRRPLPPLVATHSRYHLRSPARLDEGVLPWVSMAQALGWGGGDLVGFPRLDDGQGEAVVLDGTAYRERDVVAAGERPATTLTHKVRSWSRWGDDQPSSMGDVRNAHGAVRPVDHPAATLTSSMDNGNFRWVTEQPTATRQAVAAEVGPRVNNQSGSTFDNAWPADRPSPVVAGRDLVGMPGPNANRTNGSTKSRNDGVRVTVAEAAVLQSFRADYPWQGTKTAQYRQVGDAIPPLLAAHIVASLTGLTVPGSPAPEPGPGAGGVAYRATTMAHSAVRALDAPAPTVAFGHDAGSVKWVYVNGTHEHAARRDVDGPAPTVMFGALANTVTWQADPPPDDDERAVV